MPRTFETDSISLTRPLAELMLFYAECGVNFTLDFGDINEPFYDSVEGVFFDGLKTLKRCDPEIVGKLLPRFVNAVQKTDGMGWGFHDSLLDALESYFPGA